MDVEELLTNLLIATFIIVFLNFACRFKKQIESNYTKSSKRVKQSKKKVKEASHKEAVLCKDLLYERTNRHCRSVVAASLKQETDEELAELRSCSESIKLLRQKTYSKASLQRLKRIFAPHTIPGFDSLSTLNNLNKTDTVKRKNCSTQSKRWKTWRTNSRKNLNDSNDKNRNSRKRKLNESLLKNTIKNHFFSPHKGCIGNLITGNPLVYSCYNACFDWKYEQTENVNNTFRKAFDLTTQSKACANSSLINCLNNQCNDTDINTDSRDKQPFPLHCQRNYFQESAELNQNKSTNPGISNNDWPINLDTISNTVQLTELVSSDSSLTGMIEKYKENKLIIRKTVSTRQLINKSNLKIPNITFYIDLVCLNKDEDKLKDKIVVKQTPNNNIVTYNRIDNSFKVINFNICKISVNKNENSTYFIKPGYVMKISLKLNRKKVILKIVFPCVKQIKKDKYNSAQLSGKASKTKELLYNNKIHTFNNCKTPKHRPCNTLHRKRHSLYTNTSCNTVAPAEPDGSLIPVYGEGDIFSKHRDRKMGSSYTQKNTGKYSRVLEDDSKETDKAILKQCIELTKDCFEDCLNFGYKSVPQFVYQQLADENKILSTIEEEIIEDDSVNFHYCNKEQSETWLGNTEGLEGCPPLSITEDKSVVKAEKDYLMTQQNYDTIEFFESDEQLNNMIEMELKMAASRLLERMDFLHLQGTIDPCTETQQRNINLLNSVLEVRSFDETSYVDQPSLYLSYRSNNMCTENLFTEDYNELDLFENFPQSMETCLRNANGFYSSSDLKLQIKLDKAIDFSQTVQSTEETHIEDDIVLRRTQDENALILEEALFINNRKYEQTSNQVLVVKGALVCSSTTDGENYIWEGSHTESEKADRGFPKLIELN